MACVGPAACRRTYIHTYTHTHFHLYVGDECLFTAVFTSKLKIKIPTLTKSSLD